MKQTHRLTAAWPLTIALVVAIAIGFALRDSLGPATARVADAGLPLLALVPFRALPLALDAAGWWILLGRAPPFVFIWWIAAVRDGVSRLLPVASIGGEAVGVRLACWKVHDLPAVVASVIVEVLITLAMQAIFATIGIAVLARSAALGRAAWPLAAASATTIVAVAASYVWLRHGAPFLTLMRVTRHVLGRCHSLLIAVPSCQLDDALRAQTHAPRRWLAALIAQLTGQVVGAFENQFALWAIGVPITFSNALAIEAVAQIARHVAFFVPLGVGVQDAAIVLTSQIAGLSTEAALSLALIKRMREVLSGGLGIGSWLLVEAARGSHLWDAEREKRQLH
ncbi:lysylphosphatidylglycerol synthase domain-containing protein [Caballeronia sp. RCC_10]|uniref:lysylphosphatidylglycerol synthase domain-containing protein n=1 Tax=Caballeronia sp. RCC_10 TaxID=3239227 RepID=UPI0035231AD1